MKYSLKFSILLFFTITLFSQTEADKKAVVNAIEDYIEGIYTVQAERIDKSVDVTLRKYGYWFNPKSKKWSRGGEMNFKQLHRLAETWNVNQKRVDPKTAKKEIKILDILDKTASAKLVAHWGIDYLHLSKQNGKWMIMNVIWQSHPPKMD